MKSLYSFLSRVNSASNVKLSTSIATNPTENLLKKFILRTAGVVVLFLFLGGDVWGQTISEAGFSSSIYTSSVQQFVVPTGVTSVIVECWGAGGGPGRGSSNTTAAGAGGGGGYAKKTFSGLTGGSSIIYLSAGSGGAYGSTNGAAGTAGGNTWANISNNIPTNNSGALANGGGGGAATTTGGTGGTGVYGDVIKNGGAGASGSTSGAGGGAAGNATANGNAGSGVTGGTGTGFSGSGGTGGTGNLSAVSAAQGGSYGGGGAASYGRQNGGMGGSGFVKISWTIPTTSDISTFPWSENFDGLTSTGQGILPSGWISTLGGGNWTQSYALSTASVIPGYSTVTYNDPSSAPNYMTLIWPGTNNASLLWSPGFVMNANQTYTFSFKWAGDGYAGWSGSALVNSSRSTSSATTLGTFVSGTTTTTSTYTTQTYSFTPTSSGTFYFGIRVIATSTAPYVLGFDDFSVTTPIISSSQSLTSFSACNGSASSNQSISVSGANMNAGITITPPVGFEVSTSSTFESGVGTNAFPLTIGAAGTISSTTVYVRLTSSATGTPSGNIALTSSGASIQNIAVSGTVITPASWGNIQWPTSQPQTICGAPVTFYGQVFKSGITEAGGVGSNMTADLGWSNTNSNPNTWTNWTSATFNAQQGNNDEFRADLGTGLTEGTWYYAFRYSYAGCPIYGGYGGIYSSGGSNGTAIVPPSHTASLTSGAGSDSQTICKGTSITSITYTIGNGATNAILTSGSFPTGVSASVSGGVLTISGTPTSAGVYSYSFVTSGTSNCAYTFSGSISVNETINWANIQSPASGTICSSGTYNVYGRVYQPGVTEAAGQGSGITVQLGYNTTNSDPSTWTNWVATSFNVQSGNNDEYMGTLSGLAVGTYYYTFRYKLAGSTACAYQYGGYNVSGGGFWNGTTNVNGVLTINSTPTISSQPSTGTQSVCVNGSPTALSLTATGVGTLTYQWYSNNAPSTTNATPVGTNSTYTPSAELAGTLYYYCAVTNTCGTTNSGFTGAITVNAAPTGITTTATASNASVCAGGTSSLSMSLINANAEPTYSSPNAVTYPTTDEDIGNITITQGSTTILNNTTARNSLIGAIGTATGTAGSYSNFTTYGPYTLSAGQTYSFSLSSLQQGNRSYLNSMAIYIDYNRNGDFSDAGEAVYLPTTTTGSGAHTVTGTFTIPNSVYNGLLRMRIISNEGTITAPNMSVSYGEFEEYMLNISSSNNGGGPATLVSTYTWSNGTSVIGSTNPYVETVNATTTYIGTATLPTGCSVTASTSVMALNAPVIATQPVTLVKCVGQAASFTVVASGTSLTYQWKKDGVDISGATSATYTVAAVALTDAGSYTLDVSGCGTVVTSNAAVLTVNPNPTVSASSSSPVCANTTLTLTGTSDIGTTFSWTGPNSFTSTSQSPSISSPTTSATGVYTFTASSNGCSSSGTTYVTVNPLPSAVTITPTSATICNGNIQSLVASGGNFSNQTIVSENFNSGVGTFSVTSSSSTTNQNWAPQSNGYTYSTSSHTGSITGFMMANSDIAGLGSTANTRLISPSFSTVGYSNISLTFLEYLNNPNDIAAVEISSDNFTTSTILRSQGTTDIGTASSFNSTILAIPVGFENLPSVQIRFRFEGTWDYWWAVDEFAVIGTYTYSAVWSPTNSLYSDATASTAYTGTSSTTVYAKPTTTTTYTATATSAAGCSSTANVAITVTPVTTISAQSTAAQAVCLNGNFSALSVTAAGTGTLTYQWYSNTTADNTTGTSLGASAQSATYTPSSASVGTKFYYCIVTGTCGTATSTVSGAMVVNPLPTASISGTVGVCVNATTPNITFTGASGTAPFTFTYNINGGSNQTVTTTSGNSVTVSAPTSTAGVYAYNLVSVQDASSTACSQAQTGTATVTVTTAPNAGAITGTQDICTNGSTTFTSNGDNGGTWTSGTEAVATVNGSTGAITPVSAGTSTITYTVTGTGGCSNTTATRTVTVYDLPTATASNGFTCGSGAVTLYASNVSAGATTDWYATATGGAALASGTGQFTTPVISSTTSYFLEARNITAGCVSTTRVEAIATVGSSPSVTFASNSNAAQTVCQGSTLNGLTVTPSGTFTTYQWYVNSTQSNTGGTSLGASAQSASYTPSSSTAGTNYYYCTINGACGSAKTAASEAILVNSIPAPLTLTGSSYCSTTSNGGTVTSSGSTVGVNYQLFNSNNDALTTIAGSGNALTWSSVQEGNGYYVIGSTAYCSSLNSNTVNVTPTLSNSAYVYYADADGDTYGSNTPTYGCSAITPSGYLTTTGDCNDAAANVYPTATELCGNNIDENCSGPSDDMPSYYRTIADGNWGDASTWQTACAAGVTYTAAAYPPPTYYTGMVNIRDTHDVIIPANGTTYQTGTLDIDAGGSLTMTGNDYLNSPTTTTSTVNGVTTTTSNVSPVAKLTVTLLIDNAGTLNIGHQASLVQSSTTAANVGSGNINVESKLTGGNNGTAPNGRYWYVGSPMNNTSAGQFFDSQSPVWTRLWSYNATNNSWGVVIHSQTNTNSTLKLIPGIGYLYRAGSNKTIIYTGTAAANLNNDIESNLLTPTQDATLVQVEGYNTTGYKFVANPYPSYVDWKLVTRSGLNVSYWIRNASNTAYEAFNATTSVSTSPSGQTTQFIPPMQGFWVYAFNSTPSLRIDNTDRVHSTNVLHTPVINQVVRLKLNDGKSSDYAVVYENELASNDFEETDTDKMFDYDFHQLYTMEGEHELALNGLLNATAKGSVSMGMVVPNSGPYTLEATDLGVEEEVILEDKFNHTFQDMKVNPIYSFTSNAGTFNNRFVLHFTATESVDVSEAVTADDVRVFNTSNNQVKVWVTNTTEFQNATVKVYDAIGNMIERKNMTSNELYLDLDIASGIYVVEVTGAEKTFTKKVFIGK